MQISKNYNTVFSKINIKSANHYKTKLYQNDVFQKNNIVSFNGIQGLFKTSPNNVPRIEILPNVSDDFVSRATKQINEFSSDWLKKFKNANYKIILSPTYSDAYKSQQVFDPAVEYFEKQNPKGTLGVTYCEGKFGRNFFVFCDKPPYSDKFMKSIVNHELSHGVENILGLDKNKQVLELIQKDINAIIQEHKLDKLNSSERQMVSHYFFNKNAHLPIDEIIADTYAWNKGAGCYGSGLVMGIVNPDLIKNLFPNLSRYLKAI